MKKRLLEWAMILLYFGGGLLILTCLVWWMNGEIHSDGAAAFRGGVPANANPYTGRDPMSAGVWLRGWMSASKQQK